MMWFWLWTALVLGTLVGAFFLGRRLWRAVVALGRELARSSELLARLAEQTEELSRIARERQQDGGTSVFATPQETDALRAERRRLRAEAVERRAQRLAEASRRWRALWT